MLCTNFKEAEVLNLGAKTFLKSYFRGIREINTQYMRNPDMVYLLKMEYVSKINIFGLKMILKSGVKKYF